MFISANISVPLIAPLCLTCYCYKPSTDKPTTVIYTNVAKIHKQL